MFYSSDESIERVHKASKKSPRAPLSDTVLGVVRLDPSTERSLVSEAPPGHLTFALLVDAVMVQDAVKSPLIQAFADVVHPYSGWVLKSFPEIIGPKFPVTGCVGYSPSHPQYKHRCFLFSISTCIYNLYLQLVFN